MPLLNNFKLGADPEFIILANNGDMQMLRTPPHPLDPWGTDHGGWVIEPHPKPELSVRKLVDNLKVSMNDFATKAPTGKWRAGAFLRTPQRAITLGGHIHIDRTAPGDEISALDHFTKYLERLDILPTDECAARRDGGNYGHWSDVRVEHGHYEYRSFPSWLFSQRVTKLCMLATKLATVDPASVREALGTVATAAMPKLKAFYERFKGKDTDVDWVLESGMLDKKLVIDPNKDLRDVWKVEPKKEDPHWKTALYPTADANVNRANLAPARAGAISPMGWSVSVPGVLNSYVVVTRETVAVSMTNYNQIIARIQAARAGDEGLTLGARYYAGDQSFSFKVIGLSGADDEDGMLSGTHIVSEPNYRVTFSCLPNQNINASYAAELARVASNAYTNQRAGRRWVTGIRVSNYCVYQIREVREIR